MKTTNFRKAFMLSLCCISLAFVTTSCKKGMNPISTDWQLCFFETEGVAKDICLCTINLEMSEPAIISGFSGVNNFHTTFTQKGSSIQVDKNIAVTRMAGEEDKMIFENDFLSFLANASAMTKENDGGTEFLKITSDNGTATFKSLYPTDALWNLSLVKEGDALVSLSLNDEIEVADDIEAKNDDIAAENNDIVAEKEGLPTLVLDESGNASVFTGINVLNTTYKIDKKSHTLSFDIENGAMTLASGSDEDMKTESTYLNLLSQVKKYALYGKDMMLIDKDGSTLLSFEKQDLM